MLKFKLGFHFPQSPHERTLNTLFTNSLVSLWFQIPSSNMGVAAEASVQFLLNAQCSKLNAAQILQLLLFNSCPPPKNRSEIESPPVVLFMEDNWIHNLVLFVGLHE